jgi:3,4-dehydroadipyl-CoA semialdehyde dehydrogenase
MKIPNYVMGEWRDGTGEGIALVDPCTGEELARASSDGVDLSAAVDYARAQGGPALRALSFKERGALLAKAVEVLNANRDRYADIALRNSGNTKTDAAIDIDGGTGTLFFYSRLASKLGDAKFLKDSGFDRMTKDEAFQGMHIWVPLVGAAIHINAFNFPAWGLWEKAACAIASGVPVVAKPATSTALLSYAMVKDVIDAQVFPKGALNLIVGNARALMDATMGSDAVAFTGSADTAAKLRANATALARGTRFNAEADSLNLSLLGPDVTSSSPEFELFVKEVAREMTVKAGQKCTAIRRALVPAKIAQDVSDAIAARLAKTVVGNPRNETVRMGPLVNRAQQAAALDGIRRLAGEAKIVTGGPGGVTPLDADPRLSSFVAPTLLYCGDPRSAEAVHEVEVFGPVCTLMAYNGATEAYELAARGGGSLVASLFTGDDAFAAEAALALAPHHGRVLMVDEKVGAAQTGHGIVMPMSTHGGPGRAGGGEELGGTRGLRFYHQRTAIQGRLDRLQALGAGAAEAVL